MVLESYQDTCIEKVLLASCLCRVDESYVRFDHRLPNLLLQLPVPLPESGWLVTPVFEGSILDSSVRRAVSVAMFLTQIKSSLAFMIGGSDEHVRQSQCHS